MGLRGERGDRQEQQKISQHTRNYGNALARVNAPPLNRAAA
jgi:hypothetical protein